MKKNAFNFWLDVIVFIDFIALIFTGVLLRNFPSTLSGISIVGVTRHDWVDLHWVLALSLILFIFIHLALHWSWTKGSSKRYLKVGPRTLAISVVLIIIFFSIVMPGYLTKDFPNRKDSLYKLEQEAGIPFNNYVGRPIASEIQGGSR
jgi:amino acid transporter